MQLKEAEHEALLYPVLVTTNLASRKEPYVYRSFPLPHSQSWQNTVWCQQHHLWDTRSQALAHVVFLPIQWPPPSPHLLLGLLPVHQFLQGSWIWNPYLVPNPGRPHPSGISRWPAPCRGSDVGRRAGHSQTQHQGFSLGMRDSASGSCLAPPPTDCKWLGGKALTSGAFSFLVIKDRAGGPTPPHRLWVGKKMAYGTWKGGPRCPGLNLGLPKRRGA